MYPHVYIAYDLCVKGEFICFKSEGHYRDTPKGGFPLHYNGSSDEKIKNGHVFEGGAYMLDSRIKAYQGFLTHKNQCFEDKKMIIGFMKNLTCAYFLMSTYDMFIVYPKHLQHLINMQENAKKFLDENMLFLKNFNCEEDLKKTMILILEKEYDVISNEIKNNVNPILTYQS